MKFSHSFITGSLFQGALLVSSFGLSLSGLRAADVDPVLLERGRYLVEQVGMCGDCHSPRDEKGELIADQHLRGASLSFAPKVPMPAWASIAPSIAGLPTLRPDKAEALLSTGQGRPTGAPRPPMPSYRFSKEDAKAVVVYLKSLKPKAP